MVNKLTHVSEGFAPIYSPDSRILILGSFPSVKSRDNKFYYGNPQNRFWRLLSSIYNCPLPNTISDKKEFLTDHQIALWDIVKSCDIIGSSDSSISNIQINDVASLLAKTKIKQVFANGTLAGKLYKNHQGTLPTVIVLPSTSPANAAYSFERLKTTWLALGINKYL